MSDVTFTTTEPSHIKYPESLEFATYSWPVQGEAHYDESLSQTIIALDRNYPGFNRPITYRNILHYDAMPVKRAQEQAFALARQSANALQRAVHFAYRGYGGGFSEIVYPRLAVEPDT